MNTESLIFENDDQRRRAVAWVVALVTTLPLAAQIPEPPHDSEPADQPASSEELPATSVYQVLYRSTGTKLFTSQELLDLLEYSRHYNLAQQITGLLLYSEGRFVQAIEGQEEIIISLFERIKKDGRHHQIEAVSEGLLPARRFSEWSMDFGYAAEAEAGATAPALPGLSTTKAHLQRLLEIFIG